MQVSCDFRPYINCMLRPVLDRYCDARFPDKAQQITHSNTFHANEGEYVCHICGKKVIILFCVDLGNY